MKIRSALGLLFVIAAMACAVTAQQVPDPDFHFANPRPAFQTGQGPVVCIDEAHHNFHTAGGRYSSFADMLRGDGYQVEAFAQTFSAESLKPCRLLVIANAIAAENDNDDWAFPHPSAFSKEELPAVYNWIRAGGSLFLIVDHSPMPGSARDLGTLLGVAMFDGYARGGESGIPDIFSLERETLKPHAILSGRNEEEAVQTIATFTGHAFLASRDFAPVIVFGPKGIAMVRVNFAVQGVPSAEWPVLSIAGWLHGATRTLGKGRVMVLGEAAMCSAQLAGPEKVPMGMNHPQAKQNAQFCLNAVRWLTGVLDPPAAASQSSPQK